MAGVRRGCVHGLSSNIADNPLCVVRSGALRDARLGSARAVAWTVQGGCVHFTSWSAVFGLLYDRSLSVRLGAGRVSFFL